MRYLLAAILLCSCSESGCNTAPGFGFGFGHRVGKSGKHPFPLGLVRIPAGVFSMGSPSDESDRGATEYHHRVHISRPFYIGKWSVTQQEYEDLIGTTPAAFGGCPDCPVETITWDQATAYVDALSAAEGLTQCYTSGADPVTDCDGYRLTTEAEHEYATRAGCTGTCGITSDTSCTYDAYNDSVAWHCGNADCGPTGAWASSAGGYCPENASCVSDSPIIDCNNTQPKCQKTKNGFGLCDMQGNVFDWNHDQLCATSKGTDPEGTTTINGIACSGPSTTRAKKGGSIKESPHFMRPAARTSSPHDYTAYNVGMRIARTINPSTKPSLSSAITEMELGDALTWDYAWRGSNCPSAASAFVSSEGSLSVDYDSGTWSCNQTTTSLTDSALDGEDDARMESTDGCWTIANPFTVAAESDIYIRFIGLIDRPASGSEVIFRFSQGAGEYLELSIQSDGDIYFARNTASSATIGTTNAHTLSGGIPSGAAQYMVIDAWSDGKYGHMRIAASSDAGTVWGGTAGSASFGSHEGGNFGLLGTQGSCTTPLTGGLVFLGVIFDSSWTTDQDGPWQTPTDYAWVNEKAYEAMCASPPCT